MNRTTHNKNSATEKLYKICRNTTQNTRKKKQNKKKPTKAENKKKNNKTNFKFKFTVNASPRCKSQS